MAYRLQRTESVADGLRRLARKELRSARVRLHRAHPPSVEAVHDARKRVKKIRAIVRVIDSDGGRGLDGSARRLRSVNRTLSTLRDAAVMLETLSTLRDKYPQVLNEHTFARVRRRLMAHVDEVTAAAGDGAWKRVDRKLRALRKQAKRWRLAHGGFGALAPGIRHTHRRGRTAMARALERERAADFHEWRQEMKTLWYELRLVEGSAPQVRRDARALHRAETWLGDDHNMAVLCDELARDRSLHGQIDLQRLQCAADAYQRHLREKATALVRGIYDVTSGAYVRRIRRSWREWRRKQRRRPAAAAKRAAA